MRERPRLLDVCCCAGCASEGYAAAGFEVVGVDLHPQPRYPYEFIQADLLDLDPAWIAAEFDALHISPPCQKYTRLRHRYTVNAHPDLIGPARRLAVATGLPYVIENVEDARGELVDPVMLCGRMFPGLRVFRHRYFETGGGLVLDRPEHASHRGVRCHTLDKRKKHYGTTNEWTDFVMVNGGGNCSRLAAADAMGMNHRYLTKDELNEAIPPAYTRHIGEALMAHLTEGAAA
jgi:DNA (cytosine-5)-methyltransferase 1